MKTHPTFLRPLAVLILSLAAAFIALPGASASSDEKIVAYFFWGEGCPHCEKAKPYLQSLEEKNPSLEIRYFETWHNPANARFFAELSKACGKQVLGVPTLFIGDEVIVGFTEKRTPPQIEQALQKCFVAGCADPARKLGCEVPEVDRLEEGDSVVDLPLFGRLDTRALSLPLFTILIGLLDGFNPCAMWVLTFLLTLIIYARSRKKILLIGGVFVIVSGAVYFLFMSAWLNFFLYVGYVQVTRVLISLVAIAFGIINVKDFFWFKKGVSLTIPEKYKPGLFRRMRALLHEQRTLAVLVGTGVLAAFANVIELLCTAGFPAIYTRVLTLNHLSTGAYYAYLVLYNTVYIIPLAVIVGIFAWTLGGRKFTEKEGRILKLVGGALMLALGLILLLKPELIFFG